jgi:hypothetical protein
VHTGQSDELYRSVSIEFPRVAGSSHAGLGHWTLSGAPKIAHSKSFAPNLFVSPTEFLSWFVLNLMHLR